MTVKLWRDITDTSSNLPEESTGRNFVEFVQRRKWLLFDPTVGPRYLNTLQTLPETELTELKNNFQKNIIDEYYDLNIVQGQKHLISGYLGYLIQSGRTRQALDLVVHHYKDIERSDGILLDACIVATFEARSEIRERRPSVKKALRDLWYSYRRRFATIHPEIEHFFQSYLGISEDVIPIISDSHRKVCDECRTFFIRTFLKKSPCMTHTYSECAENKALCKTHADEYCRSCAQQHISRCHYCKEEYFQEDVAGSNGTPCFHCAPKYKQCSNDTCCNWELRERLKNGFCQSCYGLLYTSCTRCHKELSKNTLKEGYCLECHGACFKNCIVCKNEFAVEKLSEGKCPDCENLELCPNCGTKNRIKPLSLDKKLRCGECKTPLRSTTVTTKRNVHGKEPISTKRGRRKRKSVSMSNDVSMKHSCPRHNVPLRLKKGRYGPFYGCPRYPYCKHTEDYP